jgi:FixJ family two-component response regulator
MATKTQCIYIVDDDASVRKALARLFKASGLPVETFGSAVEFLESHKEGPSCCLVLDVRMPGMTGLDLQKKLTARGSNLPVIFITAHDDENARKQAMENGAAAWLMKPVNEDELLAAVAAVAQRQ